MSSWIECLFTLPLCEDLPDAPPDLLDADPDLTPTAILSSRSPLSWAEGAYLGLDPILEPMVYWIRDFLISSSLKSVLMFILSL